MGFPLKARASHKDVYLDILPGRECGEAAVRDKQDKTGKGKKPTQGGTTEDNEGLICPGPCEECMNTFQDFLKGQQAEKHFSLNFCPLLVEECPRGVTSLPNPHLHTLGSWQQRVSLSRHKGSPQLSLKSEVRLEGRGQGTRVF